MRQNSLQSPYKPDGFEVVLEVVNAIYGQSSSLSIATHISPVPEYTKHSVDRKNSY